MHWDHEPAGGAAFPLSCKLLQAEDWGEVELRFGSWGAVERMNKTKNKMERINRMKTKTIGILAVLVALSAAGQAQYMFTKLDCPLAQSNGTIAQHIEGTNVVGHFWDVNLAVHGFLYTGGTNWTTLDDPLAGSAADQGTFAEGISGTNIVGQY